MTIKLRYRGSLVSDSSLCGDLRQWDLLEPRLPGYDYKYGYPTFGREALKELGLVK